MQFFADTLDIRRTMPLELPERTVTGPVSHGSSSGSRPIPNRRTGTGPCSTRRLAWWELTASSINDEVQVFDPRLLQLFASGRLIAAVWTNYQPFIQAERKRNSEPGLYDQLEIVAKRWLGAVERRR